MKVDGLQVSSMLLCLYFLFDPLVTKGSVPCVIITDNLMGSNYCSLCIMYLLAPAGVVVLTPGVALGM
jgi:hypothetical protein